MYNLYVFCRVCGDFLPSLVCVAALLCPLTWRVLILGFSVVVRVEESCSVTQDFEGACASFVNHSVPVILHPLLQRVREAGAAVGGLALVFSSVDGLRLEHWTDSDGRVLMCPDDVADIAANPAMDDVRQSGRAGPASMEDAVMQWAVDALYQPWLVVPVASRPEGLFGYLVVLADRRRQLDDAKTRELCRWMPTLAALLAHGIQDSLNLTRAVRFASEFIHARDWITGAHQLRLAAFLQILVQEMGTAHGFPDGLADEVMVFGSLHDIGKVAVPDSVLHKPGSFDASEQALMRTHVERGAELVERMVNDLHLHGVRGLDTLRASVACHHEYLDGSGYPNGRSGEDIPLVARMVTIADIFDAVTCDRPYKRGWAVDDAYDYLATMAGDNKLDRECVAALRAAQPRIVETMSRLQLGARTRAR